MMRMQSMTGSDIVPVFTGAGKSSIIAALTRLVDIQDGRILLHGCIIQAMPLACLRRQVAVIPQQPFLFQVGLHLDEDAARPPFWNDNAGSFAQPPVQTAGFGQHNGLIFIMLDAVEALAPQNSIFDQCGNWLLRTCPGLTICITGCRASAR